MALPLSGPISVGDIATEMGVSLANISHVYLEMNLLIRIQY